MRIVGEWLVLKCCDSTAVCVERAVESQYFKTSHSPTTRSISEAPAQDTQHWHRNARRPAIPHVHARLHPEMVNFPVQLWNENATTSTGGGSCFLGLGSGGVSGSTTGTAQRSSRAHLACMLLSATNAARP